jgi:hypothetical protein
VNWRSKRQVLLLIVGAAVLLMLAGMAAAWYNRKNTTCSDGKPPLEQRGGVLGQTEFLCHNGKIITTPG